MSRKEGAVMNNSVFTSVIAQYIEHKRNLGYKFQSAIWYLKQIEALTVEMKIDTLGISKELSDEWCRKKDNEAESTRYLRISILAQFSSYLNNNGIRSYVPELPKNTSTFKPYVFSNVELKRIFYACDHLKIRGQFLQYADSSMPVIIRLLYGTGIRIGEALSLRNSDVDFTQKTLFIRDNKNGQERLIQLSDSLTDTCLQYHEFKEVILGSQPDDSFFFIKRNRIKCSHSAVYENYRRVLYHANINHGGKGNGPRIHDFRHTFAVHALAKMAITGSDLYCTLPVLATYLGHKRLVSTDKYVRLTADMYPELLGKMEKISSFVFLNQENDGTN